MTSMEPAHLIPASLPIKEQVEVATHAEMGTQADTASQVCACVFVCVSL